MGVGAIRQWHVTLLVTEGMMYDDEYAKHIVADRLIHAIPGERTLVTGIRKWIPGEDVMRSDDRSRCTGERDCEAHA